MHHRRSRAAIVLCSLAVLVLSWGALAPAGAADTCFGKAITIKGTAGNDQIDGTTGDDVIDGGPGNDTIKGLTGNDRLCGGDGDDTIEGGGGRDRIDGGNGNDNLQGGGDTDRIYGGRGHDTIDGGVGDNQVLLGQGGRDQVFVHTGTGHRLDGGPGTDTVDFRRVPAPSGSDYWAVVTEATFGQPTEFWLDRKSQQGGGTLADPNGTYDDFERILGSRYRDVLEGTLADDFIHGRGGNDNLLGKGGDDDLLCGAGDDQAYGSDGDDYLDGGPGTDWYDAGLGWDTCHRMEHYFTGGACELYIIVI